MYTRGWGLVLSSANVLAWKRGTEQADWMHALGFRREVWVKTWAKTELILKHQREQ